MSNRRKSKRPRKPPTRAQADRRRRGPQSQRQRLIPSAQWVLAGALGFRVAQKAVEIMARHQDLLMTRFNADGTVDVDWDFPAADGAVLRTILAAANDCWGLFDKGAPEERIWSTILQLIELDATIEQLAATAQERSPEP